MAQHNTVYGAVDPTYGYGQGGGYMAYQPPNPPMAGGFGNANTYGGQYGTYDSGYDQSAPTYNSTGSYGAIGEPVKQAGIVPGQFASPPQESNWQGYDGSYGNTQQYGTDMYSTQAGYNEYSTQSNYQQDSVLPSYGFASDRGGTGGNRGHGGTQQGRGGFQQGRGGFDGTDGYSKGGRGAMRGRGRGQYGGEGQIEGESIGRGRGQFEGGSRGGRGQFNGGNRGYFGGENRGRGRSRGRGYVGGENVGGGQFDNARGQGCGNRGRGKFEGGNRGRGDVGANRGRGWSDGGSRGRGQFGSTRGRGWVPEGAQGVGQDSPRGRGQFGARGRGGARGSGQSGNRGRGQNGTSGRGQYGGGQINATRGNGQANRGRGRGIGAFSAQPGIKTVKPFKMSTADAQGFISYKNNLQEYAQKCHKPIPQYTSQKADIGYTATVCVDGQMYSCLMSQREKKDAEQSAAFEALKALGYIGPNEMFSPKLGTDKEKNKKRPSIENDSAEPSAKVLKQEQFAPAQPRVSYKSKLNETVMKMRLDLPTYTTVRSVRGFLSTLLLNGQTYEGVEFFGTKKLAEQHVAEIVFNQLDSIKAQTSEMDEQVFDSAGDAILSMSDSEKEPSAIASSPSKPPSAPKAKATKNIVQEYCQKNGMQIPIYNTVKDTGMFIATVTVNGVEYVGTPHIMKKTAEQNAAKKVCEQLGLK